MRSYATWSLSIIGLVLLGCNKDAAPIASSRLGTDQPAIGTKTGSSLDKLKIEDVKIGTGRAAKAGDRLSMTYIGRLRDKSIFDSNDKAGGQPFRFMLGAGSVIKGWDQGIVGMKAGGERNLLIPASLGYGDRAQGEKIPANSDLFFNVKLLSVVSPEDATTITSDDKKKGTGPALQAGETAVITYTVLGDDGSVVDDSYSKKPYTFKVGGNETLAAVDVGVRGMKAGGDRLLTVPAMYGPHNQATQNISMFKIEVKLITIKPGK